VAARTEEAARERLRVATTRFKEDAALLRDVLQQQETLATATYRRQQALLAFWSARAEFLKALGRDGRP
jgi:outer membrane protein TolC